MYREPRGSIYHPHRGETITLGTLMVEDYERPGMDLQQGGLHREGRVSAKRSRMRAGPSATIAC